MKAKQSSTRWKKLAAKFGLSYSYPIASKIGSLDAYLAGNTPEANPSKIERVPIDRTEFQGTTIGYK